MKKTAKPKTKNGKVSSRGIFGSGSNFSDRCFTDYNKLKKCVDHCKGLGLKVVLTQGSWDMAHIGHGRYFEEARKHGDLLIVGVDSDEKIRARKGPGRPVVPQEERLEMLTHMRHVDIVVLKELKYPKWHLIKMIRPNVLWTVKETYNDKQRKELKKYCDEVLVSPRMATTSTSAKLRMMQIHTAQKLKTTLTPQILNVIEEVLSGAKVGGK
ncbi:MAG TPA: adenylyltransferase/cytidyltransferase family protein [Candidatus Paceibacterota bacterium]